jgi:tetrathionate reductase subunit B
MSDAARGPRDDLDGPAEQMPEANEPIAAIEQPMPDADEQIPVVEEPASSSAEEVVEATVSQAPAVVQELTAPVVEHLELPPISRRQLLKIGAAAAPCLLGATAVFEWLTSIESAPTAAIDPVVAAYDATAHRWGFIVDTRTCIGCGRCVIACKQENNVPTDDEHTRTWVERRSIMADGSVQVDSPDQGAHGFPVEPAGGADPVGVESVRFVPHLCMQCEQSPCTVVCPVGATFRTQDGVVLVDETRCIGCGYCVVACPYGARYIVPAGGNTPTGTAGVADKCTFCYHRITRGQSPACVAVCPVGARKFGDLNDPSSEVSLILREQPSRVLRPELGTRPRVHYLGLDERDA